VSFGRTESAERSYSPSPKDAVSILDAPMKKRIDHVYQTYDVIAGESKNTKAVRDNLSPQYKVTVDKNSRTGTKKLSGSEIPLSTKNIVK